MEENIYIHDQEGIKNFIYLETSLLRKPTSTVRGGK
jgi:hypothetical protein